MSRGRQRRSLTPVCRLWSCVQVPIDVCSAHNAARPVRVTPARLQSCLGCPQTHRRRFRWRPLVRSQRLLWLFQADSDFPGYYWMRWHRLASAPPNDTKSQTYTIHNTAHKAAQRYELNGSFGENPFEIPPKSGMLLTDGSGAPPPSCSNSGIPNQKIRFNFVSSYPTSHSLTSIMRLSDARLARIIANSCGVVCTVWNLRREDEFARFHPASFSPSFSPSFPSSSSNN